MQDDPKYQEGDPLQADDFGSDVIISSDTLRENRIPAGQSRTRKWPVLHFSHVPFLESSDWQLQVFGLVDKPLQLNFQQFRELPRVKVFSDFHCVTRWSRLGNLWEGVSAKHLLELVSPKPDAKYVVIHGYDGEWTTNLPYDDFADEDVLLADIHDGEPIDEDHGGPVRLVVPKLYAWKSAKWVKAIEFVGEDQAGYWESVGYHMRGNPWTVSDEHPDGERFREPKNPPPGAES